LPAASAEERRSEAGENLQKQTKKKITAINRRTQKQSCFFENPEAHLYPAEQTAIGILIALSAAAGKAVKVLLQLKEYGHLNFKLSFYIFGFIIIIIEIFSEGSIYKRIILA